MMPPGWLEVYPGPMCGKVRAVLWGGVDLWVKDVSIFHSQGAQYWTKIKREFVTGWSHAIVTSAASVDDYNNQIQFSNNFITALCGLLYSTRSAHQKPPLQRVSPFYTYCGSTTSLTIRDISNVMCRVAHHITYDTQISIAATLRS